jgi:hypothetical protein
MKGIPEKMRYEIDIPSITAAIVNEMKEQNWIGDYLVLDRAFGGGQIVNGIEKELTTLNIDPSGKVYGCELHQMDVNYAIHKHGLKGTYIYNGDFMIEPRFDNISFLPGDRNFKYIEVGNYPYNDGSVNNNVIWDKFISDVRKSDADAVGVVVQASFISQRYQGMSKKVKQDLAALGCYKIIINEYSDFPEDKAKVKTCIVFCRKGYQGLIDYVERRTGRIVRRLLDEPFDMIFDEGQRNLLDEIEKAKKKSFDRFPKWVSMPASDKEKWCIGSYYRTEGFDKNPLKPFILLDPNGDQAKDHYVVFGKADTKEDAETLMEQVKSFWFNDAVQAVLLLTRYQISLDSTQYAKIPKTKIDHVFTEDELFNLWNITDDARQAARELVKTCDYKKKADAKDN